MDSYKPSPYTLTLTLLAVLGCLLVCLSQDISLQSITLSLYFTENKDFRLYWSAWNVLSGGQSPYVWEEIKNYQWEQFGSEEPIMMFNPPTLTLLFYPILSLPYQTSLHLWTTINLICGILGSTLFLERARDNHLIHRILISCCGLFLFTPFLLSLRLGQTGGIILLAAGLIYCGLRKPNPILLTLGVLISSIKFHLFLFIYTLVLCNLLQKRCYRSLTLLTGSSFLMILLTELIYPGQWQHWINMYIDSPGPILPFDYTPPTILSVLKGKVAAYHPGMARAFMIVSTGLAVCLYMSVQIFRKQRGSFHFDFSIAAALPFIIGPFGWLYDQTSTYIIFLALLTAIPDGKWQRTSLIMAILFSLYASFTIGSLYLTYFQFWWHAPLLLSLFIMLSYSYKKNPSG